MKVELDESCENQMSFDNVCLTGHDIISYWNEEAHWIMNNIEQCVSFTKIHKLAEAQNDWKYSMNFIFNMKCRFI